MKEPRSHWLDEPRNVTRLVWTLFAVCLGLVLADVLHLYARHGDFGWEQWTGFHAFFGFLSFFFLVLAGGQLRRLLKRDEDYYDR